AAELAAKIRLNDACLAVSATYGDEMDRYVAALAALDGDLSAFIVRLRDAAEASDPVEVLLDPAPRSAATP
ncbi:MAG: hypothetical protein ACE5FL_11010, partial [Myxococcota bacterium]